MAVIELMMCVHCGQECEFEQPPCADGHGDDCPELACVECGFAIVTGAFPVDGTPEPEELGRTA